MELLLLAFQFTQDLKCNSLNIGARLKCLSSMYLISCKNKLLSIEVASTFLNYKQRDWPAEITVTRRDLLPTMRYTMVTVLSNGPEGYTPSYHTADGVSIVQQ